MFRFLSFLLILLGAGALAYGGYQYLQEQNGASDIAPRAEAAFDIAEGEASEPVRAGSQGARDLPIPSLDEAGDGGDMFGVASIGTGDVMGALQEVPIAHETPSSAQFGRAFTVTVAIDATGDSSAADALPGNGNIVESVAQISASVRASVSGEAFDVEAITPEIQRVSPLTENVWRWKVTPTATGNQDLVIELFALIGDEALPVRTFRDSVEVEVSRLGQAIAFARSVSPITIVAGGIGSLLAGLFGFISFFRRR